VGVLGEGQSRQEMETYRLKIANKRKRKYAQISILPSHPSHNSKATTTANEKEKKKQFQKQFHKKSKFPPISPLNLDSGYSQTFVSRAVQISSPTGGQGYMLPGEPCLCTVVG